MTETNICSGESSVYLWPEKISWHYAYTFGGPTPKISKRGTGPVWVGGQVGGTYRKRSETQGKTRGVTVDAQRVATEAGYFESVVLPWIEICFR